MGEVGNCLPVVHQLFASPLFTGQVTFGQVLATRPMGYQPCQSADFSRRKRPLP